MNFAYIVSSDDYCWQAELVLKSLSKNCDCGAIINLYNPPDDFKKNIFKNFDNIYLVQYLTESEWVGKRMFCKIKKLLETPFKYGDNVFVMDTDLFVQDDIFKVFRSEHDVYYTTRNTKRQVAMPINAGFWGFNFNRRSEKFLNFYVDQMLNPTWEPYVDFEKHMIKRGRNPQGGRLDWWCDQDFLNAVYLNGGKLPFDCKVRDLGPKYNFFPIQDAHIGNKEYKVLHFKSGRKRMMKRVLKGL